MLPFRITRVVACKLRQRDARGKRPARSFEGHLMAEPKVGERLFLFRPEGEQLISTPIRRLLVEPDGQAIYVETQNSVYRLTFGAPRAPSTRDTTAVRVRARIADDGSEITFVDEPACPEPHDR